MSGLSPRSVETGIADRAASLPSRRRVGGSRVKEAAPSGLWRSPTLKDTDKPTYHGLTADEFRKWWNHRIRWYNSPVAFISVRPYPSELQKVARAGRLNLNLFRDIEEAVDRGFDPWVGKVPWRFLTYWWLFWRKGLDVLLSGRLRDPEPLWIDRPHGLKKMPGPARGLVYSPPASWGLIGKRSV